MISHYAQSKVQSDKRYTQFSFSKLSFLSVFVGGNDPRNVREQLRTQQLKINKLNYAKLKIEELIPPRSHAHLLPLSILSQVRAHGQNKWFKTRLFSRAPHAVWRTDARVAVVCTHHDVRGSLDELGSSVGTAVAESHGSALHVGQRVGGNALVVTWGCKTIIK